MVYRSNDMSRWCTTALLADPADCLICPVRLLLDHALRIGACMALTYNEIIDSIRGNRQKTLP